MSNNIKQTDVSYCKVVSYANILKTRGNDKMYQEAIEASSKFNKRLINERKMRIPFIDSQTTVAQANCMIWNMEYQRTKTEETGYVYSYPVKRWYKNRRLAFENDSSNMLHRLQLPADLAQQQMSINENSNHSLMDPNSHTLNHHNHHHHHHQHHHNNHHTHHAHHGHQPHIISKQASNSNDDHEHYKGNGRLGNNGMESEWHDSYENFNDLKDDNDVDSEADDYEDSKRKKGKRGRGKKAQNKETTINGDDKPFVCDKCGVKYKTKPGLSYHVQKAHGTNSTPSTNHNMATSSKTHDLIENENTNSVFDSVYDDMNSSSSLPQSSSNHQNSNTNFSTSIANINSNLSNSHSKTNVIRCGVCNGSEVEGRSGQQESFVSCCECTKAFHPLCLNFTANMIKSVKKYKWQCIECKRCTVCGNSENDDKLLFCDDCDRGYHMYCLNPPLTVAPEGDWRCDLCVKQFGSQS